MRLCHIGATPLTKVIILPDEDLDRFYERTLNYLHAKYHCQPTSLRKSEPTERYDRYSISSASPAFNQNSSQISLPMGKLIG